MSLETIEPADGGATGVSSNGWTKNFGHGWLRGIRRSFGRWSETCLTCLNRCGRPPRLVSPPKAGARSCWPSVPRMAGGRRGCTGRSGSRPPTRSLQLWRMGLPRDHSEAISSVELLLDRPVWVFGVGRDECVAGFGLALSSWFTIDDDRRDDLVLSILESQLDDGGWNCRTPRTGSTHSSFHTTINVVEGLREYALSGGRRTDDTEAAERRAMEFFGCPSSLPLASLRSHPRRAHDADAVSATLAPRRAPGSRLVPGGGCASGRSAPGPDRRCPGPSAQGRQVADPRQLLRRGVVQDGVRPRSEPMEHAPGAARASLVGTGEPLTWSPSITVGPPRR